MAVVAALSFGNGAAASVTTGDAHVYLSSTTGGTVGGITFADEDILKYDTSSDQWSLHFDGSDVLPVGADVDGFAVAGPTTIAMSFTAPVSIPGLGIVDDSDVVLFFATSLGPDTAGTFSVVLDGSDVGLTTANEDISALILEGEVITASTLGGFNVPKTGGGNLTGADEDLITIDASTWARRFDGSDVDLSTEDLWGASVNEFTGELYGASLNNFNVPGLTGDGDDVFVFTGTTGEATSGTFDLFWDGDGHGFGGEQIDGLHVEILAPPPPGDADLSITKTDSADPVLPGDLLTYTVTVANAGPDTAENVVVTDTPPAGVTFAATDGCQQDPNGLTCSLGDIPANGSAQYILNVIVDDGTAGTITNSAVVAAGTGDPNIANNSTSEDTLVGAVPLASDDGPATNSSPGDAFHTSIEVGVGGPSGALFANDTLGDPAAQIVSFGGGSNPLDDVTTHAAGSNVAFFDGSISIGSDGSFTFVPPIGFTGVFTVDYRLENVLGFSDATLSIFVGERTEVTEGDKIYLSSTSFGTVDGIIFADEDILVFDNALDTWELFFDGSDVLPAGADVNGFTIEKGGRIFMSFQNPVTITGLGTVDDSDIVEFNATTLGESTTGFFTKIFDGTDFGLTTAAEDISALTIFLGDVTVSTAGSFNVPKTGGGNMLGRNEDLINISGPGTWSLLFDGSDVDLAAEDLAGVSIDEDSGDVYATSFNGYNVPGLSGDNNDVIVFAGNLGDPTSGTFSTFFDGDDHRFGNEQIDALHVVLSRNDDPVAVLDEESTDEETALSIAAPGVLANDSDPDGDPVTVIPATLTTPNDAAVTINADGSFTYDPTGSATLQALDSGDSLVDSFSYNIEDGNGGSAVGTVEVTVQGLDESGSITIVLDNSYVADVDTDSAQDFRFSSTELGAFILDDPLVEDNDGVADSILFADQAPGNYTVLTGRSGRWNSSLLCVGDDDIFYLTDDFGATIDLDAGEDVTCTFSYERITYQLTYAKSLAPDTTPPAADWQFTLFDADGPDEITPNDTIPNPFATIAPAGGTSTTFTLPADDYLVGEVVPAGYDIQLIDCGEGGLVGEPATDDLYVQLFSDMTCRFTNRVAGSGFTIVQDTVPDDSRLFGYSYRILFVKLTTSISDDGVSRALTFSSDFIADQANVFTQEPVDGWSLTDITCNDPDDGTVVDVEAGTVVVDLDPGENFACIFTNVPGNNAPDAVDDFYTTPVSDGGFTRSITVNDSDPNTDAAGNGDQVTISNVTYPDPATGNPVSVIANGAPQPVRSSGDRPLTIQIGGGFDPPGIPRTNLVFYFEPEDVADLLVGQSDTLVLTYTITDNGTPALSDTATVTITLNGSTPQS